MDIMDLSDKHPTDIGAAARPDPGPPVALGDELAERCEAVRAHLVGARGGAPFLSGADSRLLLRWLEGGVPVPAILSAIDAAVERRRKRPVRGRLSLSACGKELGRWLPSVAPAAPAPPEVPALDVSQAILGGYVAEVAALDPGAPFGPCHARLVSALSETAALTAVEDAAAAAMRAVRQFHEACWDALAEGQAELIAEAEANLAPLQAALSATTFAELVEATARDRLRARFPTLSAREVWDRLQPGAAA